MSAVSEVLYATEAATIRVPPAEREKLGLKWVKRWTALEQLKSVMIELFFFQPVHSVVHSFIFLPLDNLFFRDQPTIMYVAVSLLNHGCIFVGSTILFI